MSSSGTHAMTRQWRQTGR